MNFAIIIKLLLKKYQFGWTNLEDLMLHLAAVTVLEKQSYQQEES